MVPGFWPRVGEESSDAREGRFEQHLVGYDKAIAGNGANIFQMLLAGAIQQVADSGSMNINRKDPKIWCSCGHRDGCRSGAKANFKNDRQAAEHLDEVK